MASITFLERYQSEETWTGKVHILEIFHLSRLHHDKSWTVTKTAQYFGVSIGLVSENLKIARISHRNPKILQYKTREEALRKL